jgi:hypothetical protein
MRHFRITIFNDYDTCDDDDVAMFIEDNDLPFEFSRWPSIPHNTRWNIRHYLGELRQSYENS